MVDLPVLTHRLVTVRGVRVSDSRPMEEALAGNREWLSPWEATIPWVRSPRPHTKASIRSLLQAARQGSALPLVIIQGNELIGQVNVSQISYGSLSSASLGYWIVRKAAGRGITPVSVALATDYLFLKKGLHRMEVCVRPENTSSLRVVQKLGFRYEGLRRRYIHIDGKWSDHFAFALVAEEVPRGVLARYEDGAVPAQVSEIPELDWVKSRNPVNFPEKSF